MTLEDDEVQSVAEGELGDALFEILERLSGGQDGAQEKEKLRFHAES
jgi:hypothetical protein